MNLAAVISGAVLAAYQALSLALRWKATWLAPAGAERTLARVAILSVRGSGLILGIVLLVWGLAQAG